MMSHSRMDSDATWYRHTTTPIGREQVLVTMGLCWLHAQTQLVPSATPVAVCRVPSAQYPPPCGCYQMGGCWFTLRHSLSLQSAVGCLLIALSMK